MIIKEDFIFPPPPDPRSPFRLHLAGSSYCTGNYRIDLRKQDFCHIFEYVEKGRGTLKVNGSEYFPQAGDVYIVPDSGDRSYWSSREAPWVKHWFNVSGPLIPELLKLYSLENVHIIRNFSSPELFLDGLSQLRENPQQAHLPLGPDIIHRIIARAAADILTSQEQTCTVSEEGLRLRNYLDRHLCQPMPELADMAAFLHRSPAQVIRIFRRDFGDTPYHYLLNQKIAAAQELLYCTKRSIKEIAAHLHFSGEYYFAGLFKKKTGFSPGRYRKKAGEGGLIDYNLVESGNAPGKFVNRCFLPEERP